MRKSFVIVLCIIAALVAVTSPLQIVSAQDSSRNSGTISGVVLNEQRMPLAGGSVRLWRVYEDDSRVLQTGPIAITDATGRYRLNNVPPGTYLIESLSSVAS